MTGYAYTYLGEDVVVFAGPRNNSVIFFNHCKQHDGLLFLGSQNACEYCGFVVKLKGTGYWDKWKPLHGETDERTLKVMEILGLEFTSWAN